MLRSTKNNQNLVTSSICFLLCFMTEKPCFSSGADTLSKGEHITESQTLISKDGIFEVGFFKPGTTSSHNTYLGIWYKDFPKQNVVWVANREKPLPNTSNFNLKVVPNGNLELYHDLHDDPFWSTSLNSTLPETVEAVLLDDGNLILRDGSNPAAIFWQSFDHPTHVWLAGAAVGTTQRLVSWKSSDDPSPGPFSLETSRGNPHSFFLQWNMSTVYWRSGDWNAATTVFKSAFQLSYLYKFSFFSKESGTYMRYSVLNPEIYSMLVLDPSGNLSQLAYQPKHHQQWTPIYALPKNDIFGLCGGFGIFSENSSTSNPCRCLQGFVSREKECSRRYALQCESSNSTIVGKKRKDGFLSVSDVKFPANQIEHPAQTARECMAACELSCSCTAYAFTKNGCLIWEGALLDLKNVSRNEDFLYLRLDDSEFQNSKVFLFS